MAGSSRTRSGVGNMLAFLPNPSPIVLAKFWVCRSCMIGTGKIDEPRRFSEVTKEDGWGPHNLGTGRGWGAQEGGSQTRVWRSRTGEREALMAYRTS